MFTSSTGDGWKLRITSFALLLVPALNSFFQSKGVNIAPGAVESFIDSAFVVAFGIFHIYGWMRAYMFKKA